MANDEIQNKTLKEISEEADKHFSNTTYSQRQYDQWVIAKMAAKIVELEKIIQDRAK